MGRVMALDVGTKTIGVAVTDPLRLFGQPVTTLGRRGVKQDVARLLPLIDEYDPDVVVVGLPLELDGSEERSARLARQVGEAVGQACDVRIDYHDERYSSVEAERHLLAQDVSRARRKQVIDQVAAVVILESWMRENPK